MQGFYLSLPDSALDQLREIAARGSRPPRDQATILLADAIAWGGRMREVLDELGIPPHAMVALLEARVAEIAARRAAEQADAEPAAQAAG